jgi:hypothetical protein
VRLTVRVRLTLLYTGLFVACGAILLAVTYGLVARSLADADPADPKAAKQEQAQSEQAQSEQAQSEQAQSDQNRDQPVPEGFVAACKQALKDADAEPSLRGPDGSWPAGCCVRCTGSPRPPGPPPGRTWVAGWR